MLRRPAPYCALGFNGWRPRGGKYPGRAMNKNRVADRMFRRRVYLALDDDGLEELEAYASRREREGFWAGLVAAGLAVAVVIGVWPTIREGLRAMFGGVWW